MIILAVDSTAITASAAITDDEKLLGITTLNTSLTHSETLLPAVDAILKGTRLNIDDVELFVCSAGPGSFTGVRIGVAMLKGLAFPKNLPCVGVSTLDALSENLFSVYKDDSIICPVMDARRSQLYNAIYQNGIKLCDDRLISIENLKSELEKYPENIKIRFAGDGYILAKRAITFNNTQDTPELLRYQNAYSVAVCALRKYNAGLDAEILSAEKLAPIYLRASQAERERNAKIGI